MNEYTKIFSSITIADIPSVGGKNASLGEMLNTLKGKGIPVPDGFWILNSISFNPDAIVKGIENILHAKPADHNT